MLIFEVIFSWLVEPISNFDTHFYLDLAMIKSVRLQNFFSFEDETIELHPEANVFVGINGSGKSNVLKAFKLLQEGMAGRLRQLILDQWGGFDAICNKRTKVPWATLTFIFESHTKKGLEVWQYEIVLYKHPSTANYYVADTLLVSSNSGSTYLLERVNGRPNAIKRIAKPEKSELGQYDPEQLVLPTASQFFEIGDYLTISNSLGSVYIYDYFDTTPGSKIRRPVIATSEKRLANDGSNLTQLLNTIKINDKDYYRKIVENLKNVNQNFSGIDFNFIGGNIDLMLDEAKYKSSVHVTHISDGTLRFLCLMSIFFNDKRGTFICIDEPELGLHPDMIISIREAMSFSYGKTQFLIATHSDHLLDLFGLENIRVVEKDENNASHIRSLDPKAFEGWYETFSPGRMWRMGDFGGNRF